MLINSKTLLSSLSSSPLDDTKGSFNGRVQAENHIQIDHSDLIHPVYVTSSGVIKNVYTHQLSYNSMTYKDFFSCLREKVTVNVTFLGGRGGILNTLLCTRWDKIFSKAVKLISSNRITLNYYFNYRKFFMYNRLAMWVNINKDIPVFKGIFKNCLKNSNFICTYNNISFDKQMIYVSMASHKG